MKRFIAVRLSLLCIAALWGQPCLAQSDTPASCVPAIDTLDSQKVFLLVDKMPEFPDGHSMMLAFIHNTLQYPKEQQEDFQGSIYVTFIIDTTGKTRNACIYKRFYKDKLMPIEKEALRVIDIMPKWSAGEKEGKKVPVRITLPIKFGF